MTQGEAFGGRFEPCPDSPNCVSSQADHADTEHYLAPLPFTAPIQDVMAAVAEVLKATPRTKITTQTDRYVRAEARSRIFRFVDDIEVYIDEAEGHIHFRSASRVGYSDLGVNRKRLETFKEALRERL